MGPPCCLPPLLQLRTMVSTVLMRGFSANLAGNAVRHVGHDFLPCAYQRLKQPRQKLCWQGPCIMWSQGPHGVSYRPGRWHGEGVGLGGTGRAPRSSWLEMSRPNRRAAARQAAAATEIDNTAASLPVAARMKVGDLSKAIEKYCLRHIGPLASPAHRDRTLAQVEANGAFERVVQQRRLLLLDFLLRLALGRVGWGASGGA
jgi:hypothetical protein